MVLVKIVQRICGLIFIEMIVFILLNGESIFNVCDRLVLKNTLNIRKSIKICGRVRL